jgi:hypothetical protein
MYKPMKKLTIVAIVVIVLIAIAYIVYGRPVKEISRVEILTYTSEKYGFSFKYPDSYELSEREVGNAEREQFAIVLTPKESLPLPEAGEGPTTISIHAYQNDLDGMRLAEWLTGTNDSNFKLSNGTYATTTVAGAPAVRYAWSGLYEAHVVAFERPGAIVAITGTYITPTDAIVADFEAVVQSVELK